MESRAQFHKLQRLVFLLLFVPYVYVFPRWAHWGQNSKMDLTMAIVDQGTFSIDDYYQNTGDYALYKGRHYSDKAPGTAFMGVLPYALFKSIARIPQVDRVINKLSESGLMANTFREGGTGFQKDKLYYAMALSFGTIFVTSLPSAILGVLLFGFLSRINKDVRQNLFLTATYGLATIALPHSQAYSGRQAVACLLFAAFFILFRIKQGEISRNYLWLVGVFMGWSVISDYPSILIAAGIFIYAFYISSRKRDLLKVILGGSLTMLCAVFYNFICFESPLPVGYFYSELYTDLHQIGFLSLTYPKLEAIWGLTLSPFRGLFYLSPVLLLALLGLYEMYRHDVLRAEFWLCLLVITSFFLFNSSSAMWWAGFSVGPTYLLPMLPFLTLPIIFTFTRWLRLALFKVLLLLLTAWSIFAIWVETLGGQSPPDLSPNPLWAISWPAVLRNDIARNWGMLIGLNGLSSIIPLFAYLIIIILIIRQSVRLAGNVYSYDKRLT